MGNFCRETFVVAKTGMSISESVDYGGKAYYGHVSGVVDCGLR
jgi:hypothetical protein